MPTTVYLSNDASGISGYLAAYINERSPNASATASQTYTSTVAGVTTSTVTMTLTSTGAAAKWITVGLKAATTIAAKPFANIWAYESSLSANALVAIALQQYTTTAQTAFVTTSTGTELAVNPTVRIPWVAGTGEAVTSTAFAAGDRLIIAPALGAVGTMATGFFGLMTYNQLTSGSDGDTYVTFAEDFEPGSAQIGGGTAPAVKGTGVSYYQNIQLVVQNAVDAGVVGTNATVSTLIDEATNQMNLV